MDPLREQKKSTIHPGGSTLWARALRTWHWLWAETSNSFDESRAILTSERKTKQLDSTVSLVSALRPPNHADSTETSRASPDLVPLKLITWLGASAGGLTILLIALGFLAVSAHDAMLGIPRSIQNNQEYVVVGGLFFGRSIIFLLAAFVSLKSWILLGILFIGVFVLFNMPRRPCRGRSLVIILCSVALLGAEVYGLERLIRPLQISNLLLNFSIDPNSPGKRVVDAILVKDTRWLGAEYGFLVLLVLALLIAFIFLDHETHQGTASDARGAKRSLLWRLLRVPAFTLLLICSFLLPRAYGILTISNDYPEIKLESSVPSGIKAPDEARFLLREDEKGLILYDPTSQSIVTVKRESIAQYRVYAPQHIFSARVTTK